MHIFDFDYMLRATHLNTELPSGSIRHHCH